MPLWEWKTKSFISLVCTPTLLNHGWCFCLENYLTFVQYFSPKTFLMDFKPFVFLMPGLIIICFYGEKLSTFASSICNSFLILFFLMVLTFHDQGPKLSKNWLEKKNFLEIFFQQTFFQRFWQIEKLTNVKFETGPREKELHKW